MSERGKFHNKYTKQLVGDASDKITGPKLTVNILKANRIRCTKSGELLGRDSGIFKKAKIRCQDAR